MVCRLLDEPSGSSSVKSMAIKEGELPRGRL